MMSDSEKERLVVKIGRQLAREVFRRRGNHREAHVDEVELAGLLALAASRALESAQAEAPSQPADRSMVLALLLGNDGSNRWSIVKHGQQGIIEIPEMLPFRSEPGDSTKPADYKKRTFVYRATFADVEGRPRFYVFEETKS